MLLPAVAAAQSFGPLPTESLFDIGPVGLSPSLTVRDVGVDSNVFNTPDSPSRDVTAVVVPGIDAAMRVGAARLTSRTLAEWHYFQKSSSERAVNLNQLGRIDLELARLAPYAEAGYFRSRHRPNFEIDERVLETIRTAAAGLVLTLGARTDVDLGYRRSDVAFGDLADGSPLLADRLNRTTEEVLLELRRSLTPLSTLMVTGRHRRDRFAVEDLRDSDHARLTAGLSLKPSAFVSGTATVGVGRLTARHPSMPDYTGVVADVRMSYILLEQTRFAVRLDRDVDYSFETAWPFFVATGAAVEIKQAVGYVWDVVARGGRTELAYRPFAGTGDAGPASINRRDDVVVVGLGGGRHFGEVVRVGVDVTHERRSSPIAGRSYAGYRVGGSLTYGY